MKALFCEGMLHIYSNPKMTDINKVKAVTKELEKFGYLVGADESDEGEDFCLAICSPCNTTIKEMKEDYQYCKTLI